MPITPPDDAYTPSDSARAPAANQGRYKTAEDGSTRDSLLDRPVAMRRVDLAAADDLQAEARFLSRLHHPGLPCVFDFVRDDAGAALITQPIVGRSLAAAVIARESGHPVAAIADPTTCVLTFLKVCDALGAAHLRGVLHDRISPANIILCDDGQVVIDGWDTATKAMQRPLTMRFCAHAPVPAALPADGLHVDIRDLGGCIYTAVAGEAPPTKADGHLADIPASAAERIPRPLLAIIRKAMASSAAAGYQSIPDLRADLVRFVADQTPEAQGLGFFATLRQGLASRARHLATAAVIIAVLAGSIIAYRWRDVSNYATWGAPLVAEQFRDESWKSRWGSRGRWEQRDGRLMSQSEFDCALIFKQRLTPPVAIEYTGRFGSDVRPGDLSVWWCEEDALALRANDNVDNTRSWFLQAGAIENSWCTIWETPARLRTQVNNLVLRPDHDYRFRAEIETDRLRMWIDGDLVLEHRVLFPIGSGTIALYSWDPGKAFSNVRIWQHEVPELVSPLAVGDEDFRAGRYAEAATAYGRVATSHKGKVLGNDALYYQGLALHRQGSRALATRTWQSLPEGTLRRRAECLSIDDLVDEGDLHGAVERFTTMWRDRPDVRDILRQRWQACGQRIKTFKPVRTTDMETWIGLRDSTFPEDRPSRWLVAEMLNQLGRWDDVIARFPDERRSVATAMLHLGRNSEVATAPWTVSQERIAALVGMGDVAGALRSPDLSRTRRLDLLCKSGRADEAARLAPYPALIYLNRIDEALANDTFGVYANAVLIAAGRLEEAGGAGVAGSPRSGKSPVALILLGRLDEAERLNVDVRLHRLLAYLTAGRLDEATALRAQATGNRSGYFAGSWFAQGPGLALVDTALGQPDRLRATLVDGSKTTGMWGNRMALVCAAALDASKDEAVSNMPWRTEAGAWLLVAQALRHELAGDRPAARQAWIAFTALPPVQRLLEGHGPSLELQSIAAWRIAALQ